MSNEELQQLKALALAATPGPWSECGNARGGCSCGQVWSTSADMPVATVDRGDEEIGPIAPEVYKANAKYIAAANPATILALIERIESLAAPAVANGTAELPPLPEPAIEGSVMHQELKICYLAPVHFTADQMQAYGRAAIAASTQQAAPNVMLVAALRRIESNQIEVHDEDLGENVLVCMDTDEMVEIARAALASVPTAPEATE